MNNITSNQKVIPFLWYDGQAEEAIKFYTSTFPNSQILQIKKWGEGSPFPSNWVMQGSIIINGLHVYLFDAGPQFKFNESVSFFVTCQTQAEIDHYWNTLSSNGGSTSQCGWVKDKFGLSWQVAPAMLGEKASTGEPKRVGQMMQALSQMEKLDIAALESAYNR